MVLGMPKKKAEAVKKVDPVERDEKIRIKVGRLANAIKIPPPINQFKTVLSAEDESRFLRVFEKYRPETKEEKAVRLASPQQQSGSKPIIVKFGLKHLTDLIEQKKLRLVLIAADVTPITLVVWLPTLCKKMGVSYAIVEKQETLGKLVGLKRTSSVGLAGCRPGDQAEFDELLRIADAVFVDQYEKHMRTVGGGQIRHRVAKEAN